jgi:hypothetical protein
MIANIFLTACIFFCATLFISATLSSKKGEPANLGDSIGVFSLYAWVVSLAGAIIAKIWGL